MGAWEGGLQSSGKGLGMEGREVARSSSSRSFLGAGRGNDSKPGLTCADPPVVLCPITPLYLVGIGRGWDRLTSPVKGAGGRGGVPGGVPGARYRSSGELLRCGGDSSNAMTSEGEEG